LEEQNCSSRGGVRNRIAFRDRELKKRKKRKKKVWPDTAIARSGGTEKDRVGGEQDGREIFCPELKKTTRAAKEALTI